MSHVYFMVMDIWFFPFYDLMIMDIFIYLIFSINVDGRLVFIIFFMLMKVLLILQYESLYIYGILFFVHIDRYLPHVNSILIKNYWLYFWWNLYICCMFFSTLCSFILYFLFNGNIYYHILSLYLFFCIVAW